jgi:hypothetical protein
MSETKEDPPEDKALTAAIRAWMDAMDLAPGEYLRVGNNILIPFGATITRAVKAAIEAHAAYGFESDPTDEEVESEVDATFNELHSMNLTHEDNSHYIRTAARMTAYRLLKHGKGVI